MTGLGKDTYVCKIICATDLMLMKETTFSSIYYSCERSNLWHASLKPASVGGVFFRYVDLSTAHSR